MQLQYDYSQVTSRRPQGMWHMIQVSGEKWMRYTVDKNWDTWLLTLRLVVQKRRLGTATIRCLTSKKEQLLKNICNSMVVEENGYGESAWSLFVSEPAVKIDRSDAPSTCTVQESVELRMSEYCALLVTVGSSKCYDRMFKIKLSPLQNLYFLTCAMVWSDSKKLRSIPIEVVFIIYYISSHKKKEMSVGRNKRNIILIKHNISTQNSILDTEKCALVLQKLKTYINLVNTFIHSVNQYKSSVASFFSFLKFFKNSPTQYARSETQLPSNDNTQEKRNQSAFCFVNTFK
jgi:hypothetical protein